MLYHTECELIHICSWWCTDYLVWLLLTESMQHCTAACFLMFKWLTDCEQWAFSSFTIGPYLIYGQQSVSETALTSVHIWWCISFTESKCQYCFICGISQCFMTGRKWVTVHVPLLCNFITWLLKGSKWHCTFSLLNGLLYVIQQRVRNCMNF